MTVWTMTEDDLKKHGACWEGRLRFIELFPDGVRFSSRRDMLRAAYTYATEFCLEWLANETLQKPLRAEWHKRLDSLTAHHLERWEQLYRDRTMPRAERIRRLTGTDISSLRTKAILTAMYLWRQAEEESP